jgi:lipopolysaccharide transport system ATP-binding protein
MNPAIEVVGISKSFTLGQPNESAGEVLSRLANPKSWTNRQRGVVLEALKNVNLTIQPGESVGLIGANGAGKSTLLKVLARITPPTAGTVSFRGRVGSLLEVGAGFHGELTGRENVFLNGAILGMREAEITRNFDAIVEFAGVERFIDTPVKRYSSGMYVRLAFAVAAHLRTDILLIDEVLSVGDSTFQRQSLAKMHEMVEQGRTIVFVSHHLPSVQELCSRTIMLAGGTVAADGPTADTIEIYRRSLHAKSSPDAVLDETTVGPNPRVVSIRPTAPGFAPGSPKSFTFTIKGGLDPAPYTMCFVVRDEFGAPVVMPETRMLAMWFEGDHSFSGTFTLTRPWLAAGQYSLDVWFHPSGVSLLGACEFTVDSESPYEVSIEDWVMEQTRAMPEFTMHVPELDPSGSQKKPATSQKNLRTS